MNATLSSLDIGSKAPRPAAPVYDDKGRPAKPSAQRIGTTTKEWLQKNSHGMVRVTTNDTEIIGYLLLHDLGGVRVGHCLGYRRPQYGQSKRENWVIDRIPPHLIRGLAKFA